MSLEDDIRQRIARNGPMRVEEYMQHCVSHYYATRDPFGTAGDFTTAPEISQMFGEIVIGWAAACWIQMGRPSTFALLECGPGRGTLMADGLRATAGLPGFHAAARLHLLEASPLLKEKQKMALDSFDVTWHAGLETLPDDVPLIFVANEFLDALPVRQFVYNDGAWRERAVTVDDFGAFAFTTINAVVSDDLPAKVAEGVIAEIAPARHAFVQDVCNRIAVQGGAALFIDYGYEKGAGDTLQAVRAHKFCDVLSCPGESDLTAHVDFAALGDVAGVRVYGSCTQAQFLLTSGIMQRAEWLRGRATPAQAHDIQSALARLTGDHAMGRLFKVIAFGHNDLAMPGF